MFQTTSHSNKVREYQSMPTMPHHLCKTIPLLTWESGGTRVSDDSQHMFRNSVTGSIALVPKLWGFVVTTELCR